MFSLLFWSEKDLERKRQLAHIDKLNAQEIKELARINARFKRAVVQDSFRGIMQRMKSQGKA